MKILILKKKTWVLLCVVILASLISMRAESTIYFFLDHEIGNPEVSSVSINGVKIADMVGPEKKRFEPGPFFDAKIPLVYYHGCYRKFVIKGEGKVLIQYLYTYKHPKNLSTAEHAAEIQINVLDGNVYYIDVARKGMSTMQLKEIKEKDALKKMKKKHCYELPEVIVESE